MSDFDPFSAMVVDEPTALEMAKARAAALRGQNYAGLVMGLAHDPNAAHIGGQLSQQAQTGLTQLGEMPGERLKMAMGRQKLQQEGPQAALGGLPPSIFEALTKREAVPKFVPTSYGSTGTLDTRTGAYKPFDNAGAGGIAGYTPEAIDVLARKGNATGKIELPPGVRGPGAMALGSAVLKRMVELNPQGDLAGAAAGYHADTASLASQQKVLDNAESWERTGKANLGVLLGVAQKLKDTGSPWLNQPVRAFMEKGIGDPNQTAFKAAHATVVNEYAKILSGSQGSGSVTEGARHEAESMLPLNATWEQLMAAAQILDTDAGNRIGSARQQVATIRGRTSGHAPAQEAAAPTPMAAPAAAPTATTPEDAEAVAWAKANPADPRAKKILDLHGGAK